ncbi:MAG: hypothetical protein ACK5MR_14645 [Cumulibacter sp.]
MNKQTSDAQTTDAPGATKSAERAETVARIGNLVVWGLVALLTAALGVILIPLHAPGGFLIPVAPAIALAANYLLPRLLYAGTGWVIARFLPAALWAVIALIASSPTGDGDLLISGNSHSSGVGVAYLGLGALGAVLGIVFSSPAMRRTRRGEEA